MRAFIGPAVTLTVAVSVAFAGGTPPAPDAAPDAPGAAGETIQIPSIDELAYRAGVRAWSIRSMIVESEQTISFLRITTEDLEQAGLTAFPIDGREALQRFGEKAQTAEVVIRAAMDRDRFDVRIWNAGDDRMKTHNVIVRIDGGAFIREQQWDPEQGDYAAVEYLVDPDPWNRPPLVEDRLESCVLDALDETSCALGDFSAHWLPADRDGSGFLPDLIEAVVAGADSVSVLRDETSGRVSYRLRRLAYDHHRIVDGEPQPRHNHRYDLTTLDGETMDIVGRTLVLSSIRPDEYGKYIVMDCRYRWTKVEVERSE